MITLPDFETILMFIVSSVLLVITPGPAFLYIFTRTTEDGYKAGILSVLGIETGTLLHVITVTFGLSSILIKSDLAFTIIKYGGIFYLIILGVKTIYTANKNLHKDRLIKKIDSSAFWSGVTISALNPKSILFFVVFLPQFINASKAGEASQMLFLGLLFIIIALIWGLVFVFLSNKLGEYLKSHFTNLRIQSYIVGIVYIGIGFFSLSLFTK
ncbi:LysE family translocator [Aquimarina longa]|uniref:LysE family translocator n=1 Tax=Aquimarina longa TaxID=1080221 RepID=UPI000782165A|nr:LysE family translocator [Aquimarina longa]